MEGVPVTAEEVHRILAGDRPAETREEDAALVRGYRDAMSFVLRRADDAGFKWDCEFLIGLHDRILAGNAGAGAGRFRTSVVYVVDNRTSQVLFGAPRPRTASGRRAERDSVAYDAWAAEEHLVATPGAVVDYGVVEGYVADLCERFGIGA